MIEHDRTGCRARQSTGRIPPAVNGARQKAPGHSVKADDVVTIGLDRTVRILKVVGFAERRGDASAARARAEGFTVVESARGDVNDLVRLAAARLRPEGGPLLHVAGNVVAGDLLGALRARGFSIERSILYEARPVAALSPMSVDALRSGAIGFALFFSPRTAAVFARLASSACVAECCGTITALSISTAADAALSDLPWLERHVAERPNQPALLEMLDRVLGKRPRG